MQPINQVLIRMPPKLYDHLKRQAEQQHTSLNKLIIALLTTRTDAA